MAGGDIADLDSRQGLAHYQQFAQVIHRVFRRVETCDKPTIAAVNGFALGGGTELLLCADIRLLVDGAQLALPQISLGLFPGAGGSQRLLRQISACRARELMFTGDRIGAAEAVALGLANRVGRLRSCWPTRWRWPRASPGNRRLRSTPQAQPAARCGRKDEFLHGAD